MLLDFKSQEKLLAKYGLKTPLTLLAKKESEAVAFAEKIKYPAVMKVFSLKHLHRTEVKGVYTNILNKKDVKEAFAKLIKIKGVEGVIVQKQIDGFELVIGIKDDSVFGKTIMFGTGGTMVELFNDVTFRLLPISKKDGNEMIEEVKGRKLLDGFRGKDKIDKNIVIETLLNVSNFAVDNNFKEVDFNPVIVNKKGCFFCDAKIII